MLGIDIFEIPSSEHVLPDLMINSAFQANNFMLSQIFLIELTNIPAFEIKVILFITQKVI